jgi:ADP-ribose pyrophosphatase YjhB (NUDIX family)
MDSYKNPSLAVDAVIFYRDTENIILIERKNPPLGFALPGGFVNDGESLLQAVKREVKEELSIDIVVWEQFFTYSDPHRDPRKHVVSTVFIASTTETPKAADDAANVIITPIRNFPKTAFDHTKIITDVFVYYHNNLRRRLE